MITWLWNTTLQSANPQPKPYRALPSTSSRQQNSSTKRITPPWHAYTCSLASDHNKEPNGPWSQEIDNHQQLECNKPSYNLTVNMDDREARICVACRSDAGVSPKQAFIPSRHTAITPNESCCTCTPNLANLQCALEVCTMPLNKNKRQWCGVYDTWKWRMWKWKIRQCYTAQLRSKTSQLWVWN